MDKIDDGLEYVSDVRDGFRILDGARELGIIGEVVKAKISQRELGFDEINMVAQSPGM